MLSEEELEMTIELRKLQDQDDSNGSQQFLIRSWSRTKGWSENCTGTIALIQTSHNEVDGQRSRKYTRQSLYAKAVNVAQAATECISANHMYARLSEIGVTYGSLFQGLQQCHTSPHGSVARVVKTNTTVEMPHHYETEYVLHPASIEQIISMYWPVLSATSPLSTVHLPGSIGKVTISSRALEKTFRAPGDTLQAVCEPKGILRNDRPNSFSMFAVDPSGEAIIAIEDMSTSPIVKMRDSSQMAEAQELCYKLDWEPIPDLQDTDIEQDTKPCFDTEIVIIHGETDLQHHIASQLNDHFSEAYETRVTKGTLEAVVPVVKNKLCLVLTELDRPMLATLSASQFEALRTILLSVQGILWVVKGAYQKSNSPDSNMVSGLSRTLRSEGTLTNFVTLDFDPEADVRSPGSVSIISRVLGMTFGGKGAIEEREFWARDGKLFTPRVLDDKDMNDYVHEQIYPAATEPASLCDLKRPLRGSISVLGASESLVFEDDDRVRQPRSEEHVDIHVQAMGLCATDLKHVSKAGMECSGTVVAVGPNVPNLCVGDRVAAITTEGSLSTIARVHYSLVLKAPEHLSFESLATMPIAYSTAVYALTNQAWLSEGESVLVHDAASPVGQAALAVTLMLRADPWVTVTTEKEKLLIMRQFSIPQDRIWFAGSTYFADKILAITKGNGVDVVFNTLADRRTLRATCACLARFGRFVNIVAEQHMSLDMACVPNATVFSVDFAALAEHRPSIAQRTLADVSRVLHYGRLQCLQNIQSFSASEIVAALQHVASANITDRSVVVVQPNDVVTVSIHSRIFLKTTKNIQAPRIKKDVQLLREDSTYILIGGTGGLGRKMAEWMVRKGARHLVLLSRSGTLRGQAAAQIEALRNAGANIVVRSCNVSSKVDVDDLILRGLSNLPPVRGVIHGAMVLHVSRLTLSRITSPKLTLLLGCSLREYDL